MELPYTQWAAWGVVGDECLDKITAELEPYNLRISHYPSLGLLYVVEYTSEGQFVKVHPGLITSGPPLSEVCRVALDIIDGRDLGG